MERVRRLVQLWSWLPAFRAAAETENLQRAAELLHVTPSAISRAIRLLEQDIGEALFHRTGRHLELNAAGRTLLGFVRDAMRLLDDGLVATTSRDVIGPLPVGADGYATEHLLARALAAVRTNAPELLPEVRRCGTTDMIGLLLRGHIDLALIAQAIALPEELRAEALGTLRHGIYCGAAHPLAGARNPSVECILESAFVALATPSGDPWPPDLPRRVGLVVSDITAALAACSVGNLLVVLADAVAKPIVDRGLLRRVEADVIAAPHIYALRRRPLVRSERLERVLAALRDSLADLSD